MALKIAIISEHASPLALTGGVDAGGQNVYVAHIARHLAALGYESTCSRGAIMTVAGNHRMELWSATEVAERLLALGCTVRVIDVEKLGLPKKGDAVDWLAANPAATPADIAALSAVEATNARARETNEQVVARLASMKPMDYDRVREAEAQQLGVRIGTLDAEVAKMRPAAGSVDGQGAVPLFVEVEPWPHEVNGAELLKDLAAFFLQYVFMPAEASTILALWVVHTFCYDLRRCTPILG